MAAIRLPSVDAVLTAIQAVTGEAGCLLIVKTTPAIGLTRLAAGGKRADSATTWMLIVGDDISLPDNKQPRGTRWTILVHKVAGYFAPSAASLAVRVKRNTPPHRQHRVALANLPPAREAAARRHQAPSRRAGMGITVSQGASTIARKKTVRRIVKMVKNRPPPWQPR